MRLNFLLIPLAALALSACGTMSLEGAIDRAADAACDKADACGEIGQGLTYASRNACMIDYRATFQNQWTPGRCEENINQDGFDQCVNRIEIMQCGNILDMANVLLNCGANSVCGGNG